MGLYTVKELLTPLPLGWAVGAFNVYSADDVVAVVSAAEAARSPVILQVSEGALKHIDVQHMASACRIEGQRATVPVAIQLDHGHSFELAARCIQYGFTSVMFDGSKLAYEQNVAITRKVVEVAHAFGVSVEGELGIVGGKEDHLNVSMDEAALTDPELAAQFVEATGIDIFAPAIGTAHGLYKGTPKLDFARLQRISELVKIPLVLHGGSDLPESHIQRAIGIGIHKINIGTDLKYACTNAYRKLAAESPEEFDPIAFLAAGRRAVTEAAMAKMNLFSATGKADDFTSRITA